MFDCFVETNIKSLTKVKVTTQTSVLHSLCLPEIFNTSKHCQPSIYAAPIFPAEDLFSAWSTLWLIQTYSS